MSKAKPNLTDRTIRAMKPGDRQYEMTDPKTPGLALRILPSGTKSWSFRFRRGRRWGRVSLGPYPAVGLSDARDLATEHLRNLKKEGRDPSREKQMQRDAPTVAQLAERFLEVHVRAKRKRNTILQYERTLRLHVLPRIGSILAEAITRADMANLHHAMKDEPVAANRAIAVCSAMFGLAEVWGIRPDYSNPCRRIERYHEKARKRFMSGKELAKLGKALRKVEEDQTVPWQAAAAIRLLILTGMRKGEMLSLRWDGIDLERGTATLTDSKTGARDVALGAAAREVLTGLPDLDTPWVLPAERGNGHFVGLHRPWVKIRNTAGLDDLRIHDLRHSFASVGAAGGDSLLVIGALLGHRQPTTTARYAHLANDPARAVADRISGEIAAALSGRKAKVRKISK